MRKIKNKYKEILEKQLVLLSELSEKCDEVYLPEMSRAMIDLVNLLDTYSK